MVQLSLQVQLLGTFSLVSHLPTTCGACGEWVPVNRSSRTARDVMCEDVIAVFSDRDGRCLDGVSVGELVVFVESEYWLGTRLLR